MERLSDKLLIWASIFDDETRRQAVWTASLPIVHPPVALMPDAHPDVIWTSVKAVSACHPLHEFRPQRLTAGVGDEQRDDGHKQGPESRDQSSATQPTRFSTGTKRGDCRKDLAIDGILLEKF